MSTTLTDNECSGGPDDDRIDMLDGGLRDLVELFERVWSDGFRESPYEGSLARAEVAVDALIRHAQRTRELLGRVRASYETLSDVGYVMNRKRRGKADWQEIVDVAVKWMDARLK